MVRPEPNALRHVQARLGRQQVGDVGLTVDMEIPDWPGLDIDPGQPTAKFTASARPRAIWSRQYGYDPQQHRYRRDYVMPDSWTIDLRAGGPFKPDDAELYEFRAESDGLDSPVVVRKDRRWQNMASAGLVIPAGWFRRGREKLDIKLSVTIRFNDGRSDHSERAVTLRDFLVAVVGDSLASGEGSPWVVGTPGHFGKQQCSATTGALLGKEKAGIPIDMSNSPDWMEPLAHRDLRSAHALAAQHFEVAGGTNDVRLVTLLSYATSGAEIEKGLLQPQHEWQGVGQLDELGRDLGAANRRVDALLLSIGGNDVGFADVLRGLTGEFSILGAAALGKPWGEVWLEAERALRDLPQKYARVQRKLGSLSVPPKAVFLTEYPNGIFDNASGKPARGCGVFNTAAILEISAKEAGEIEEFGDRLNELLRTEARNHGWNFVDGVANGFRRHGYCSADSWWVSAERSCRQQGDFRGMVHPNEKGHEYVAGLIHRMLLEELLGIRDHRSGTRVRRPGRRRDTGQPVVVVDHRTGQES